MPLIRKERTRTDGAQLLALAGEIDQDLDLAADVQRPGLTALDLDGIKRVTSYGVREWIRAIAKSPPGSLFLLNCRPAIVAQLNMVAGFGGNADVVSFYLPYICEACDTEFEGLLDVRTDHDRVRNNDPPPAKCPKCGADAEFDDVAAAYFAFVASRPKPTVPDVVTALVSKTAPPPSLTVTKEVLGEVTGISFSGHLDARARLKRSLDGVEGVLVVDLKGIDSHAPGTLPRLEAIFDSGADVWVTGLRAVWLDEVEFASFLQKAKGRILDVVCPAVCGKCGLSVSGELACDLDEGDTSVARATICEKCRGPAVHATSTALRARILALVTPPESIPQPVSFFLVDHREPRTALGRHVSTDSASDVSSPSSSSPGSRFNILSRVGAGGMAEVFLAEQRGPAGFVKRLVVKRILPTYAANAEFIEMFLNEARIAARINHPNVVQIYDLGEDVGDYFIAMEYVRGWDLAKLLGFLRRTGRQMPVELACRIVADVSAGLHAAHTLVDEKGVSSAVVHRDVSPHNVLISVDGAVKLTDFGVARVNAVAGAQRTSGRLKGKIIYMAPEQIDDKLGAINGQSDVFAAGIVFYELLSLVQPFRRENEQQSMMAVLTAHLAAVEHLRPEVPPELARIVAKAIERDRGVRYATADALRQDLERFLLGFGRPASVADFARWLGSLGALEAQGASSLPTPGLTPSYRADENAKTDMPTVERGVDRDVDKGEIK